MITTRQVLVVITATLEMPTDGDLAVATLELAKVLPNALREVGYLPKLSLSLEEVGE